MIEKGDIYEHYKGNLYRIIGVGRHSETLEAVVIYQALYGDFGVWVRPLEMFCEQVDLQGKQVARFKKVDGAQRSSKS